MQMNGRGPIVSMRNETTKERLGNNFIIIGPDKENNIDGMRSRLENFVNFLIENNNEDGLISIYKGLSLFDKEYENLDEYRDGIFKFIKNLSDKKDSNGLVKVHNIMSHIGSYKKKASEISINDTSFYNLTDFSKKKFLLFKLKEKHPELDKKGIKKLIQDIVNLGTYDDILYQANDLGLDELYYNIGIYFNESAFSDIENLLQYSALDEENIDFLVKLLENSKKVSDVTIKKLQEDFWLSQEIKPDLTKQNSEHIKGTVTNRIEEIINIKRKQIADFNPFLFSLNIENGRKALGIERFREIYNTVFTKISFEILEELDGQKPSFHAFRHFKLSKLQDKPEDKNGFLIDQYIIEFDIDEDFDIRQLKQLAVLLNEEIGGINILSPKKNQVFKHPLSTIKGTTRYTGYFSESGEGFVDSNIIIQTGNEGEKKLRLTLSDFSQDEYIYLISQIGYFLKNKNFVDKNQLYFDLYDRFNKNLFSSKLFDITLLKDKYESFVRDLIIPLSKEGLELGLKADNTLLAGLYGTSKSQFLMHLLLEKNWKLNGKNFFLNAITIPIDLQEFKALLMKGIGGIKSRLDKIFMNTGTPIILLVEDLDTLINEKIHGGNDEIAQAMTLFFEGLGSLPVTVVTTSNDPTKFSERLIRPNRLSKIKIFSRPSIQEKEIMLVNHLEIKNISLEKKYIDIIKKHKVFKKGTASHIGEIVKELFNYIQIQEKIFGETNKLNQDAISKILDSITISISDIDETEKMIEKWYENVSGKKLNNAMGFKPNN